MKLEIPASLCEGPFFYFLVESVNLFPCISASILSCCVSFIHMVIYSIMFFIFLVCTKLLSVEYYFESLHLWKTFLSKECSCFETSTKSFCETVYQVFSDQEQVCQFQLWFIFMHLYCDSCTCCKLSYKMVSCFLLWVV